MELEANTNPETVTTSEIPAQGTPAPEAPSAPAPSTPASESVPELPQGVPPAWKPDFKFKIKDSVHEIDPLFHSIVKDEETLKKVKRLHEQALGVPALEESRNNFKTKYESVVPQLQEYDNVSRKLDKLSYFVQQQDFGSFFKELKIPAESVFGWVKKELDLMDAPAEIRADRERANELARQKYEYEQELTQLRSFRQKEEQNQMFAQIDTTIMSGAGDIATQFNERMGEPTAFRNAVINKGAAIQQATGQRVPLEELVAMVKGDLSKVMGMTETVQAQPAAAVTMQGSAPQPKPPVIPVIKANGSSPLKGGPKSLDELKKIAAQL